MYQFYSILSLCGNVTVYDTIRYVIQNTFVQYVMQNNIIRYDMQNGMLRYVVQNGIVQYIMQNDIVCMQNGIVSVQNGIVWYSIQNGIVRYISWVVLYIYAERYCALCRMVWWGKQESLLQLVFAAQVFILACTLQSDRLLSHTASLPASPRRWDISVLGQMLNLCKVQEHCIRLCKSSFWGLEIQHW